MDPTIAVALIGLAGTLGGGFLGSVAAAKARRAERAEASERRRAEAEGQRAEASERLRAEDLARLRALLDEHREEIDRRDSMIERLQARLDRAEGRT